MFQKYSRRLVHNPSSSFARFFGTISRKDLYPHAPPPSAAAAAALSHPASPPPSAASSSSSSRAFRRSSSFLKRSALKEKKSATEARDYARKSADVETRNVPDFWEPSPPRKMSAQDAKTRPVGRSVKIALRPTKFVPPPNMPPLTYSSSTTSLNTFSPKESVYMHLAPHTRPKKPIVDIGISMAPPFDPPPPVQSPEGPFAPLVPGVSSHFVTEQQQPHPENVHQIPSASHGQTSAGAAAENVAFNSPQRRSFSSAAIRSQSESSRIISQMTAIEAPALARGDKKQDGNVLNNHEGHNSRFRANKTVKQSSAPRRLSKRMTLKQQRKRTVGKQSNMNQLVAEKNKPFQPVWRSPGNNSLWPSALALYPYALANLGINCPTKVQAENIPLIMAGKDVELYSRTGSGKTLAWALPIHATLQCDLLDAQFKSLSPDFIGKSELQCLVVAPTRELAYQILGTFVDVGKEVHRILPSHKNKKAKRVDIELCVEGEIDENRSSHILSSLRTKPPHVLICTPSTLGDVQQHADLNHVKWIIVEETDDILHGEHGEAVEKFLEGRNPLAQLVFSTATPTTRTRQLANRLMNNRLKTKEMDIATPSLAQDSLLEVAYRFPPGLAHESYMCSGPSFKEKQQCLVKILRSRNPTKREESTRVPAIIFVDDDTEVDSLVSFLSSEGFEAASLSGRDSASKRREIMFSVRLQQIDAVVVIEEMSRGLDLKGLALVVNMSVADPIRYIHRAGRVSRVGGWDQGLPVSSTFDESADARTSAAVLTLLSARDENAVEQLEQALDISIVKCSLETLL